MKKSGFKKKLEKKKAKKKRKLKLTDRETHRPAGVAPVELRQLHERRRRVQADLPLDPQAGPERRRDGGLELGVEAVLLLLLERREHSAGGRVASRDVADVELLRHVGVVEREVDFLVGVREEVVHLVPWEFFGGLRSWEVGREEEERERE